MSRRGPSAGTRSGEVVGPVMIVRLRLRDRAGALERALGLIRRRGLAPSDVEVSSAAGVVRLAARIAPGGRTAARIRAELASLHDALEVDVDVQDPAAPVPPGARS